MLEMEKRKKKSKKSLLEAKALHNKNLISTFKAGGAVPSLGGGSRGFQVQRLIYNFIGDLNIRLHWDSHGLKSSDL